MKMTTTTVMKTMEIKIDDEDDDDDGVDDVENGLRRRIKSMTTVVMKYKDDSMSKKQTDILTDRQTDG